MMNLEITEGGHPRLKRLLKGNMLSPLHILLSPEGNSGMEISPSGALAPSTKVSHDYGSIHGCTLKATFCLWDYEEKYKAQLSQHE